MRVRGGVGTVSVGVLNGKQKTKTRRQAELRKEVRSRNVLLAKPAMTIAEGVNEVPVQV